MKRLVVFPAAFTLISVLALVSLHLVFKFNFTLSTYVIELIPIALVVWLWVTDDSDRIAYFVMSYYLLYTATDISLQFIDYRPIGGEGSLSIYLDAYSHAVLHLLVLAVIAIGLFASKLRISLSMFSVAAYCFAFILFALGAVITHIIFDVEQPGRAYDVIRYTMTVSLLLWLIRTNGKPGGKVANFIMDYINARRFGTGRHALRIYL